MFSVSMYICICACIYAVISSDKTNKLIIINKYKWERKALMKNQTSICISFFLFVCVNSHEKKCIYLLR